MSQGFPRAAAPVGGFLPRHDEDLREPLVRRQGSQVSIIFCLVDLSTGVSGIFKSPTIILLLLISPFTLVSICLTYCGLPMLGAYIFIQGTLGNFPGASER